MIGATPHPQIGYVLRSYPRLSQTFILNKILALEQIGLRIHIFAVTDPHESCVQPQVAAVKAPVHYLDVVQRQSWMANFAEHLCVALASPRRYFKTLRYVMRHQELGGTYSGNSRYDCFKQAVHLARLLEREKRRTGSAINHLHAHFAHDQTVIVLLIHMLTGISYSFTG